MLITGNAWEKQSSSLGQVLQGLLGKWLCSELWKAEAPASVAWWFSQGWREQYLITEWRQGAGLRLCPWERHMQHAHACTHLPLMFLNISLLKFLNPGAISSGLSFSFTKLKAFRARSLETRDEKRSLISLSSFCFYSVLNLLLIWIYF